MRRAAAFSLLLILPLVGAGCEPLTTPSIAEPIGEAFPARPIGQQGGFGTIPGVPNPPLRSGASGSVRVIAAFPEIPSRVSVLRVSDGRPDTTLLRNASNALGLPNGVVGDNAIGHDVRVSWNDGNGLEWEANATGRGVTFTDTEQRTDVLTVSALPSNEEVIRVAEAFLDDHGVSMKRYGAPYVDPDWSAWWNAQTAQNRCMDSRTIQAVRSLSASMSGTETIFPAFPQAATTNCASPEFPSRVAVRWNSTQDGQGIFSDSGAPHVGAMLLVDVASNRVTSGFFTLGADPARSDYPGLTSEEAKEKLARGGQGGTPNGDVTVTAIRFEWYPIDDGKTPATNYLYPAIVGEGTIQYNDGTSGPYRIVVPLVQQ